MSITTSYHNDVITSIESQPFGNIKITLQRAGIFLINARQAVDNLKLGACVVEAANSNTISAITQDSVTYQVR